MKNKLPRSLLLSSLLLVACGGSTGLDSLDAGDDGSSSEDAGNTTPLNDGSSPSALPDASGPATDAGRGVDGETDADSGPIEGDDSGGSTEARDAGVDAPSSENADATAVDGASDTGTRMDASEPPPSDASTDKDAAGEADAAAPKDAGTSADRDASTAVDASEPIDASEPLDAALPLDATLPPPPVDAAAPPLDGGVDDAALPSCVIPSGAWTEAAPALPALPAESAPSVDSLINVNISINDLLYDPYTKLLYVSVPSSFGANGNSIARVDPSSGAVLGYVYVGSEPGMLAESADGQFLYVGLNGASAVRRYVLATQTADLQFPLIVPSNQTGLGNPQALAIQVLPQSPHAVLVASGNQAENAVLAVYDDGAARPSSFSLSPAFHDDSGELVVSGSDSLAFTASEDSFDPTQAVCINASGVFVAASYAATTSQYDVAYRSFVYQAGLLYSPGGPVLDILQNGQLAGTYASMGPLAVEASVGRAYFLSAGDTANGVPDAVINAYDQAHFTPTGTVTFSGESVVVTDRFVRWGRYGFAFGNYVNDEPTLAIVRTSLIPSQP